MSLHGHLMISNVQMVRVKASQISGNSIVYLTTCSGYRQKHQKHASQTLCAFPVQKACGTEGVSIPWRHQVLFSVLTSEVMMMMLFLYMPESLMAATTSPIDSSTDDAMAERHTAKINTQTAARCCEISWYLVGHFGWRHLVNIEYRKRTHIQILLLYGGNMRTYIQALAAR